MRAFPKLRSQPHEREWPPPYCRDAPTSFAEQLSALGASPGELDAIDILDIDELASDPVLIAHMVRLRRTSWHAYRKGTRNAARGSADSR